MTHYWWLLLGMAAVTFIPRMLPLTWLEGKELSPFLTGVLRNIPHAVLGALIFPMVFFVQEGNWLFGFIGTMVAFGLAFLGGGVLVVVFGSILALTTLGLFI